MDLLFDPLFRLPFFAGLTASVVVAIIGLYLRLRAEWLAALGFAHLAGAGGVAGVLLGAPALPAALAASALAVLIKGLLRRSGNDVYAWLILFGWAAMLIGASLTHHAKILGDALVDGQLYFASTAELWSTLSIAAAATIILPLISRRLLRNELFPGHDQANAKSLWPVTVGFDLLAAAAIAVTALVMGVMAAFAMVFIPAWIAFALAGGWRLAVLWSALLAAALYTAAYVTAMLADMPFAPVLVALAVAIAPLRFLASLSPTNRKAA
ncbi:metal ABC transporter permease [Halorhodospira halochloris]|uniref:metal ABC transporter permease n=1 Tax=Halorhodospira halochloris TaxID=1052 RepID=UPI001EE8DEB0|nr:metal ABC transporter permease [Halorhodospira halochloris]MCG5548265.1 metal ABC transporter permease [Halorhodospira halochloris]